MPGTQDKIAENGCNVFCVYLIFIFEGFPVMDSILKEKKIGWSHHRNLFLVRYQSENRIKRPYG